MQLNRAVPVLLALISGFYFFSVRPARAESGPFANWAGESVLAESKSLAVPEGRSVRSPAASARRGAATGAALACTSDEECADDNDCTTDRCILEICTHITTPAGTLCREAANPCDVPEFCTGTGPTCPPDVFAAPGTSCGSPADTPCDDPDTCDGAGGCMDNHEPDGTPCDDGLFCTLTDVCEEATCGGGGDPCQDGEKCDEMTDACGPAATLEVHDLNLLPGQTGGLRVSGTVADQGTFGVSILVEILARPGNTGTVSFTPSPPADIVQAGDPWPARGTFSPFDTDSPGFSSTLNGTVDDDGRFLCDASLGFSGPLAVFPVIASSDANGVWDAVLATSAGDSGWECVPTTLFSGLITVAHAAIGSLDIRPGSCPNPVNTRSKGVLPAAIAGSEGLDVRLIDSDSLELRRADGVGGAVRPVRRRNGPDAMIADVTSPAAGSASCECSAHGPDGFVDLMVKFPTAELTEAFELAGLPRHSLLTVTISGMLSDGSRFSASDCMRLQGPDTLGNE